MHFSRAALLLICGVASLQAEPPLDDVPKSTPEQRLTFARQAAADYRFRLAGRDKSDVKLRPEPLLRWNNQIVREDDGMLFIWTEGKDGRPVAAAQFFVQGPNWHHEFQSLCSGSFDARFEGEAGWSWRPNGAGLEYVQALDVEPPAENAFQRLRQMKAIAEGFSAAVDQEGRFKSPEQLRLLAKPVYRYSAEAQGILDGAMFAFTQGTNPEVLLLVEAEGAGDAGKSWRYGFARMSSFWLRVMQGDKIVWERDRPPFPTRDPHGPYYFRWEVQIDRSTEVVVPAK